MSDALSKIKDALSGLQGGNILGLDIGLSAVKIAELSMVKKGKYKLENFIYVPLSEAAIIEDEIQKVDEVIDAIKLAIRKAKLKSKSVCLGIDGPNTVTKRLQIPDGTKEEVEDQILWESEQYIPFGAEESELDFQILGTLENGIKDVMVAAVKIDVVERLSALVQEAGLKTKIVDLKVFALENIFELNYPDQLDRLSEGTLLIDFGAQSTKIIVYKDYAPILTRELSIGGVLVTEEIQRRMGISYEEAEDLKLTRDDSGNMPEEILQIVQERVGILIEEIKKVVNFYVTPGSSEQIQYCFITGGSMHLSGTKELIEEITGVEVKKLEVFNKIDVNSKKFSSELISEIESIGAVVLGLGIRK